MSRAYWHSPTRTAELYGAEHHHLRRVVRDVVDPIWGLDGPDAVHRAVALVALSPDVPDGVYGANYLRTYWREAVATGRRDHAVRLVALLKTVLRVDGLPITVAGVGLNTCDIEKNSALAVGPDTVRLATTLAGWTECHCFVEGPDREWLAGLIDAGLADGLFRTDMGWDKVTALLRERDDEPVVLSYSVTERFPDPAVADWAPTSLPDDWAPRWADHAEGRAEWDEMDDEGRASYRREQAGEEWYALPEPEQWRLAMDGLRAKRPWARMAPDALGRSAFWCPVRIEDLFAPDREDRVRAAARLIAEPEEATR